MGKALFDEAGSGTTPGIESSPGDHLTYQVLALQPGTGAPRLAREALRAWLARDDLRQLDTESSLSSASWSRMRCSTPAPTWSSPTRQTLGTSRLACVTLMRARYHRSRRRHSPPRQGETSWPLLALGGRGLAIVAAMADEWGVTETQDGKQVWARWAAGGFGPARPDLSPPVSRPRPASSSGAATTAADCLRACNHPVPPAAPSRRPD